MSNTCPRGDLWEATYQHIYAVFSAEVLGKLPYLQSTGHIHYVYVYILENKNDRPNEQHKKSFRFMCPMTQNNHLIQMVQKQKELNELE